MGQPLCCSAANAGAWGERGYGDDSTPYMWLSSIALLPWLPGFPPPAFPTMISSLNPLNPSLCYQQQPSPWHCSTIPKFPFPAAVPSRWPAYLSGLCMAVARTVWFSFHLGCHRSAVSLSALNVSPLTQTVALLWNWTPASVPPPAEGRTSPTNIPDFPPSSSSYWVFMFLCILFHWSGIPVRSQLVFCMNVCAWRCIPDVSMERDVLHIHLLLCHLVLFHESIFW